MVCWRTNHAFSFSHRYPEVGHFPAAPWIVRSGQARTRCPECNLPQRRLRLRNDMPAPLLHVLRLEGVASEPQLPTRNVKQEGRVVAQIAVPKPARLHGQAEQPLTTAPLHEAGSLPKHACMEVEGRPDTNQNRGLEPIAVLRHPALLFWRAEPNPDHIGARGVDHLYDSRILDRGEWSEGRRVAADDAEAGKARVKI